MGRFKKHGPGCPCCFCVCPDEETQYEPFSTIRIEIAGLESSYDYYNESQNDLGFVRTHEGTVTGLDAANGTYIIRAELEATLNAGCVADDEESYPVGLYEEEFTLEYTETLTQYPNFDCDPTNPFPPTVTVIVYEVTFKLLVTKEGPHWFRVQLLGLGPGYGTAGAGGMLLSGCQVFACENGFDATQDGTLTDSQKEHNEFSFPDIEGELCSEGDIWFSPFSFSTNATSTICGRAREFADMEIVGTIAANIE